MSRRKPRPGEREKHAARQEARRAALPIRDDGAGARSIEDPQRHHRGGKGLDMRERESLEDEGAMEGWVPLPESAADDIRTILRYIGRYDADEHDEWFAAADRLREVLGAPPE